MADPVEPYFLKPEIPMLNDPSHENPEKHLIGITLPSAEQVAAIGLTGSVGSSPIPAREDHVHAMGTMFSIVGKGAAFPTTPVPTAGDVFYRTDIERFYVYAGGLWYRLLAGTGAGNLRSQFRRVANLNVNNVTLTDIPWDTEDSDSEASIAVPVTNFTTPNDRSGSGTNLSGDWNIGGYIIWSGAAGAVNAVQIVNNSLGVVWQYAGLNSAALNVIGFSLPNFRLTSGQTWKVRAYQNSGAALQLTGRIWMAWVGP